jgi:hypothetical protein
MSRPSSSLALSTITSLRRSAASSFRGERWPLSSARRRHRSLTVLHRVPDTTGQRERVNLDVRPDPFTFCGRACVSPTMDGIALVRCILDPLTRVAPDAP